MITGVVLARNEERNIVDCLTALRPHVAEILLIDMESSDRTVELATPFGVQVLRHPLIKQFDAARNVAIPAARYDWLWFVDADERVSPAVGELVNRLVRERGQEFEGISIPFKTWFCGKWIEHCGWWPGFTMPRVLKRGAFRFPARIHGGVELNGRELRLPAEPEWGIDHFSYPNLASYVEKFNRYTSAEAELLADGNSPLDWQTGVRHMVRDLWLYYEANAGWRDGRQGWLLSWMAGQYRFLAQAKRWELGQNAGDKSAAHANVPENLDEVLRVFRDELAACRGASAQPPGLVLRTPLFDPSGYAEEGRLFARALSRLERPLRVESIRWSDRECELPDLERGLYRALERGERPAAPVVITNCIPTLATPDPAATLNILRTTFELDRIPEEWLPRLDAFDEIWVISEHNRAAFRRSGVPPEKLRVVSSGLDTERFQPAGDALARPAALANRFVFLSVFDWQWRKGWDVLLRAYCAEFAADENAGLWLKITRAHGHSREHVERQIDAVLAPLGTSLAARPDVVLDDGLLSASEMPDLYRAANAFVLASRGEGWGRPYLEAMACGLPVIGTEGSGNVDFMNTENSYLVPVRLVDVPEEAAREIPPYRGGQWCEPDEPSLRRIMRHVFTERAESTAIGQRAAAEVAEKYNVCRTAERLEVAMIEATERLAPPAPAVARPEQLRVRWEGELFAGHSFAKVNELIAERLADDGRLALALGRIAGYAAPRVDRGRAARLAPYVERPLPGPAQVTVRHAFPPHWQRPPEGRWVHIQPWEFGYLPRDWVAPLRDEVDEIWAPSHYVRRVYQRSGVPGEKVHVIPWGIDPAVYSPSVAPLLLPTSKRCRFLFVGGTIERKGFDTLLEAYAAEFCRDDDVCLVVKDLGHDSFYCDSVARERIAALQADPAAPEILYFDQYLTEGQLASLYTACTCLAAPYRGEGFGLPILEALASGLPALVPHGGPSDDYMTAEHGYVLPAEEVEGDHPWRLCGPALEWRVEPDDVRRALRQVYSHPAEAQAKGAAAATHVAANFTWGQTTERMTERLLALGAGDGPLANGSRRAAQPPGLSACLVVENDEATLGEALASVRPNVHEVVCVLRGSTDRSGAIAAEYGARVYRVDAAAPLVAAWNLALRKCTGDWILWLEPHETWKGHEGLEGATFLANQADDVGGLWAQVEHAGTKPSPRVVREVRLFRNSNALEFSAPSLAALAERIAAASFRVERSEARLNVPAVNAIRLTERLALWHERLREPAHAAVARYELGRAHFQLGNFFHAECYLNDFLAPADAAPEPALIREALGWLILCYERLAEPLRAEEARHQFAARFPGDAPPNTHAEDQLHAAVLGGR